MACTECNKTITIFSKKLRRKYFLNEQLLAISIHPNCIEAVKHEPIPLELYV